MIDAAIAALVFAFGVVHPAQRGTRAATGRHADGDALGIVLLALACFPLAFRRVAPSLVLVLTVAAVDRCSCCGTRASSATCR